MNIVLKVFRILKIDARFIYVTYRQPHFIKPLLNPNGTNWKVDIDTIGDSSNSFDYHGFVLTKTR